MCTALTLMTDQKEVFFGRSMDFSYAIEPGVFAVPEAFEWSDILGNAKFQNKYRFIGIGQELDLGQGAEKKLVFVDGVNQEGFAAATLYFPGYAHYSSAAENVGKPALAALEVVHYLLGQCSSVDEVEDAIRSVEIISVENSVTKMDTPLHWIATDKSGKCIVIEQTKKGLDVWDNPVGVLTNSPDFNWHLTNLRNYMNASTQQDAHVQWADATLTPFGNASGTDVLPGGYTPPARFVRTAFQRAHAQIPKSREEAVTMCFHLIENVMIPKGIVITNNDTVDFTRYVSFMNTQTCEYFFKTYDNNQIITAKLPKGDMTGPVSMGKIGQPLTFQSLAAE